MTTEQWIVITVVSTILPLAFLLCRPRSTNYPDGRCYLCRRGKCQPGETCPKCGTVQPLVPPEEEPSPPSFLFESIEIKPFEDLPLGPTLAVMHAQIDRITGILIRNRYEIDITIEGEDGGHIVWSGLVEEIMKDWWSRPR